MRFMRLKSSGVSGLASGSASAADITSASVIVRSGSRGLPVLLEIVVLLIFGCLSGANNAHAFRALCKGHENQRPLDHANQGKTVLAIVLPIVDLTDPERVRECQAGALERHAMPTEITRGFVVVPFEMFIFHKATV